MNAKRQTIWLVSMLSLMVVLSAYYLFTEDSGKVDLTTAGGSVNSTAGGAVSIDMKDPATAKVDAKDAGKVEVKPDPNTAAAGTNAKTDTKATDAKTADPKAADKATSGQSAADKTTAQAGAKTDTKADAKADAKTDAQIIAQMTNATLSGSDFFADAQLKRDEDIAKRTQDFMSVYTDQKKSIQDQEKAYNDLDAMNTMISKIKNLESLLTKDYPDAVVQQDGQKYKVSVQAQKLTPSQAVTIVDLTMKELGIGQDKVVIQYLP